MEPFKIQITEQDILETKDFSDNTDCALCKAIKRTRPNANVSADTHSVMINGNECMISDGFYYADFHSLRLRAESGQKFQVEKIITPL